MFGLPFAQIIEILVAILLILTIAYCALLNERLRRLRQDEGALRAMVGELIGATQIAERAISALKGTVNEAERSIGDRLTDADQMSHELARLVEEGRRIVQRPPNVQPRANAPPIPARHEPTAPSLQRTAPLARPAFSGR